MKMRKTEMHNGGTSKTLTVIVPAHRTVQIGTLTSIIRQSGLGRSLFED